MSSRREFFKGTFGGALAAAAAAMFPRRSQGSAVANAEEAARIDVDFDARLRAEYRRKLQDGPRPETPERFVADTRFADARHVVKLCEDFEQFGVHAAFWNEPRWHPFELVNLPPGAAPEFPLDFLEPGENRPYCSYIMPNHGYKPERCVGGDFIFVPTYDIGASCDWLIRLSNDPETTNEALGLYVQSLQDKLFYDQWRTLLGAGADNNFLFTQKDHSVLKVIDTAQQTRYRLTGKTFTDVVIGSQEFEHHYGKNTESCQQATFIERKKDMVYCTVHKLDALNKYQPLWCFYFDELKQAEVSVFSNNLAVFVDNHRNDSCVTVIHDDLITHYDPTLERQRRHGIYGWLEVGNTVLDNRMVQVGEYSNG